MVKFKEKMRYTSQAIREVIAQGQVDNVDIKIDLKVGEYVRLKHLGISKCIKIENGLYTFDKLDDECWSGDLPNVIYECELDDMVEKHSFNKIDLIEEGDYVNGIEVVTIDGYDEDGNDKEELGILETYVDDVDGIYLTDVNIKSIVTKEQFKAMEYKEE